MQQEWIDLSVSGLRAELIIWEDGQERARPLHKSTKIQKLSSANFGVPASRDLKLKAAEKNYFKNFLHSKLEQVWDQLHQGDIWLAAAVAMETVLRAMERMPWHLDAAGAQDHIVCMCVCVCVCVCVCFVFCNQVVAIGRASVPSASKPAQQHTTHVKQRHRMHRHAVDHTCGTRGARPLRHVHSMYVVGSVLGWHAWSGLL